MYQEEGTSNLGAHFLSALDGADEGAMLEAAAALAALSAELDGALRAAAAAGSLPSPLAQTLQVGSGGACPACK